MLTHDLDRLIITSAAFADACTLPLENLGDFPMHGFDGSMEVFVPCEGMAA